MDQFLVRRSVQPTYDSQPTLAAHFLHRHNFFHPRGHELSSQELDCMDESDSRREAVCEKDSAPNAAVEQDSVQASNGNANLREQDFLLVASFQLWATLYRSDFGAILGLCFCNGARIYVA